MLDTAMVLAQQTENVGPLGPEFGKASPIGLLILVLLAVAVLYIGWAFHRRFSRMNRRRLFAEQHGIDLFDEDALDKAMEEAGVLDQRRKPWF
ncbi:hypothetical protein GP475_04250 [Corynebacterium poyangense]|uniref:Uncharacterized protein n=1 Tax=Corynebacterium poyangense TaxID=2684405 RepID=A0A7H0SN16_9CORY|nr:hypothetical protein [Corynebacterium poyangense]MBZ8176955.1 hypothetical protein [Corynebacterium poyangense]QNQ89941.1 hypothetical protein GP475_04250 [Corynebacterium poyangense]